MAFRKRTVVTAAERINIKGMCCADAMHEMNPDLLQSDHLKPLCEVFDAIDRGERKFVVVTVPPRFGKSETICNGIAMLLDHHPEKRIVYSSYAQKLVDQFSRKVRGMSEANGFSFSPDHNRIDDWRSVDGGGLIATGIQGPFTGMGVELGILDDPVKDREAAESPGVLDATWDWITDVLFRGIEATGSVIVVQTRWHVRDPSGRLLAGESDRFKKWEHIHLRPIIVDENGGERSLWPERWPLAELQAIRGNGTSRTWTSLYEGNPRVEGSTIFGDPVFAEFPGDVAA